MSVSSQCVCAVQKKQCLFLDAPVGNHRDAQVLVLGSGTPGAADMVAQDPSEKFFLDEKFYVCALIPAAAYRFAAPRPQTAAPMFSLSFDELAVFL